MILAMAMAMARRSLSTGEDTEIVAKRVLEIGAFDYVGHYVKSSIVCFHQSHLGYFYYYYYFFL